MGFDGPDTTVGKARRKAILAAARTEFLSKGFVDASLRSIAKQAQCTVSNLYGYYTSKDELFSAVVEPTKTALEEIVSTLEKYDIELIEQRQKYSLHQVLDTYAAMSRPLIDYVVDHREVVRLLLLKSHGSRAGAVFDTYQQRNLQLHHDFFATRHDSRSLYVKRMSPQLLSLLSSIPFSYIKTLAHSELDKQQGYHDIDVLFRFMTVGYNYFLHLWAHDDDTSLGNDFTHHTHASIIESILEKTGRTQADGHSDKTGTADTQTQPRRHNDTTSQCPHHTPGQNPKQAPPAYQGTTISVPQYEATPMKQSP